MVGHGRNWIGTNFLYLYLESALGNPWRKKKEREREREFETKTVRNEVRWAIRDLRIEVLERILSLSRANVPLL